MPKGDMGGGDYVELVVTDKSGKVVKEVTTKGLADFKTASKDMHFCSGCGSELIEIPLYQCDKCGERFIARIEPQTGKTIIFALGKKTDKPAAGII